MDAPRRRRVVMGRDDRDGSDVPWEVRRRSPAMGAPSALLQTPVGVRTAAMAPPRSLARGEAAPHPRMVARRRGGADAARAAEPTARTAAAPTVRSGSLGAARRRASHARSGPADCGRTSRGPAPGPPAAPLADARPSSKPWCGAGGGCGTPGRTQGISWRRLALEERRGPRGRGRARPPRGRRPPGGAPPRARARSGAPATP